MKNLNSKVEITAKNLKAQYCNYKGYKLGYNKSEKCYFVGSWFSGGSTYFDTIQNIKNTFY